MDKQMIEEMAKLLQQDMCGDIPCEECNYHGKMKILPRYCGTYLIVEKLYRAGYRKIHENAVIVPDMAGKDFYAEKKPSGIKWCKGQKTLSTKEKKRYARKRRKSLRKG